MFFLVSFKPSYITWVEGNIILHFFEIAFKILFVPSTATLLIKSSCAGSNPFFAYATSVILAK